MTIRENLAKKIAPYVMEIAPYVLMTSLALAPLTGCNAVKRELSDVIYDSAIVTSKEYFPEEELPPIFWAGKTIFYFTLISDRHTEEKNLIKFTGEKVNFEVDNKNLFETFSVNDPAEVSYKEVYQSVYGDLNKDGEKELLEKKVVGYEFIDAQLKK